jgi:hypothetical protein
MHQASKACPVSARGPDPANQRLYSPADLIPASVSCKPAAHLALCPAADDLLEHQLAVADYMMQLDAFARLHTAAGL